MTRPHSLRSFVISVLIEKKRLSLKEVGSRCGMDGKKVSNLLREGQIGDEVYQRLLKATRATPAEIEVATSCFEGLEAAFADEQELTPEELEIFEREAREANRIYREHLRDAIRSSRQVVPLDEYPRPCDVEPARWLAEEQMAFLKLLTPKQRITAVERDPQLHNWALAEAAANFAEELASGDLGEAESWAQVAVEVAERMRGPEGWCKRVRGYARAQPPNVLRVRGKLRRAEAGLEEAKALWLAGSDPDQILDPGRLLDLEASLRRAQRLPDQALDCLDVALPVSRQPARILIKKGTILHVIGDYPGAVQALLQAGSRIDRYAEPRLWYKQRANLATNYSLLDAWREAIELVEEAWSVALELEDRLDLLRLKWLKGRISAGLGRRGEAIELLDEAQRGFEKEGMDYDVLLAWLEISAVLLEEERTAEVKALTSGLARIFSSNGIHPEALAAAQLFRDAVEREQASANQARKVLRFLFRARYDQSLRFTS